ncbi:MAG: hypothetical protein WC998_02325 [Candidatus Paceibacterota bacterium]|jgi:hypothetical protein
MEPKNIFTDNSKLKNSRWSYKMGSKFILVFLFFLIIWYIVFIPKKVSGVGDMFILPFFFIVAFMLLSFVFSVSQSWSWPEGDKSSISYFSIFLSISSIAFLVYEILINPKERGTMIILTTFFLFIVTTIIISWIKPRVGGWIFIAVPIIFLFIAYWFSIDLSNPIFINIVFLITGISFLVDGKILNTLKS